jgi:thioester reductase-like protein
MDLSNGVLVTGANGFFGCHLLQELQQRGVARLRCLIRAEHREGARHRLEMAVNDFRLDLRLDAIDVVAADLSKPGLGLSEEERRDLLVGVGSIVHAGACVNFTASGDQMWRTNVEATQTLLQMAEATGVSRFIYISSLAVVNGLAWSPHEIVREGPLQLTGASGLSPYARSKRGAEQCCFSAASKGLEVSVLRLPYLLASASTLAINRHGYLDVVLASVLQLGSSFDDVFSLHPLPVDHCADWVARVALATSVPPVIHVLHETPMFWRDWLEAARAMGVAIELEPMETWYSRLRQAAVRTRRRGLLEAIAFLKLDPTHRRWMEMNAHRLQFENRNLRDFVPESAAPLQLSMAYKQGVLEQLMAD